jgi:hypothetical protein
MEDQDPIKQLQSLLNDRSKVLERVSGIHAVLNSIKGTATDIPVGEPRVVDEPTNFPPDEDPYTRLLHMLHDMELQIENQVRPLAQQAVHFEVERLHERAATDRAAMHACLEHLDQCVRVCVERAEEYQREHAALAQLNQRLTALGATPEALPECPSNIDDIINSRLELLQREQGI